MKIYLSPVRMNDRLLAGVNGDTIMLNGELFDFSKLNNGDVLPLSAINSKWLADDVRRVDGEIVIKIILPHGENAPYETRFPDAFTEPMSISSGNIVLPKYDVGDVE